MGKRGFSRDEPPLRSLCGHTAGREVPLRFSFLPDGKVLGRTRVIWERGLHVGEPDGWGVAKDTSDGHILLYGHGQDHVATVNHVIPDVVHPSRGPGHEGGFPFPSRCHAQTTSALFGIFVIGSKVLFFPTTFYK